MSAVFEDLLKATPVKQFTKQFSDCQKEWESPERFLAEAADYLSLRIYARYYDDGAPHAFFGLAAASRAESLFPEDRKWWPYVQQTWFAASERKRTPFSLNGQVESPESLNWEDFDRAVSSGDVAMACRVAGVLLEDSKERSSFRAELLAAALADTFHGGLKFLFLFHSLGLAERLRWQVSSRLLFPALHLFVNAPREEADGSIQKGGRLSGVLKDGQPLKDEAYQSFESQLLFGDSNSSALDALETLLKTGVGSEGAWEALILSAAQAIINSKSGVWVLPVRALLTAHAAKETFGARADEKEAAALATVAVVIGRASQRSRASDQNRDLADLARRFCPLDTFNTLRSVVSHSDPHAAATATYTILGMGEDKVRELFENLATLAAKNDGRIGQGYDLLLVPAVAESFQASASSHREKLPVCCAFTLARLYKDYDLFGAYGVK